MIRQKLEINWELEYNLLKNVYKDLQKTQETILEKMKKTQHDNSGEIDKLVNKYYICKQESLDAWFNMIEFAKNKNKYIEFYKDKVENIVNKKID